MQTERKNEPAHSLDSYVAMVIEQIKSITTPLLKPVVLIEADTKEEIAEIRAICRALSDRGYDAALAEGTRMKQLGGAGTEWQRVETTTLLLNSLRVGQNSDSLENLEKPVVGQASKASALISDLENAAILKSITVAADARHAVRHETTRFATVEETFLSVNSEEGHKSLSALVASGVVQQVIRPRGSFSSALEGYRINPFYRTQVLQSIGGVA